MREFTSLHMVEVTPHCNLKCTYCQASAQNLPKNNTQKKTIINKIIETIFKSRSNDIKIELQGGEPLTDWNFCKYLIEKSYLYAKKFPQKHFEIIICTNLLLVDDKKLEFFKKYNVKISTSLDGTKELHDKYRKTHSNIGSYDKFIEKLELSRKILGKRSVSALLTVTKNNLFKLKDVIDEYIRLGFNGIFIRALNPYGRAVLNKNELTYSIKEFTTQYFKALEYIFKLNLQGIRFVDYFATLLFKRITTPFSTGFMDLQSPAGAGICGAIYDFNGNVYPTDEARMLARMGNNKFLLGNVMKDSYEDIFYSQKLQEITKNSIISTNKTCHNCVYNAYCGSDPIRNYVESGSIYANHPNSDFCEKNRAIFEYLMKILYENDREKIAILYSWANDKNLNEVLI